MTDSTIFEIGDKNSNETTEVNANDFEFRTVEGIVVSTPEVGGIIELYWPKYDTFYPAIIGSYKDDTNEFHVDYNTGDIHVLDLRNEKWHFIDLETLSENLMQLLQQELQSRDQETLEDYFKDFGQQDFMQRILVEQQGQVR